MPNPSPPRTQGNERQHHGDAFQARAFVLRIEPAPQFRPNGFNRYRRGAGMTAPVKLSYPRKAVIERTVAAARACGLDVAGFEVSPDGTIRIIEARAVSKEPTNDFERYEGRL